MRKMDLHIPPYQAITLRRWPSIRLSGQEQGQRDDIYRAFDPCTLDGKDGIGAVVSTGFTHLRSTSTSRPALECRDSLSPMAADVCARKSRFKG